MQNASRNKTLAKAIAAVIAGSAMSLGATSNASAAITAYNIFTTAATSDTDGWNYCNPDGTGCTSNAGFPNVSPGWVGTLSPTTLPFGYANAAHLNWAAALLFAGDSAEISADDALARYGQAVEIDTGGGAWQDNSATPTGWRHQTDIGLISSRVTQFVTVKAATLGAQSPTYSRFGVSLFEGMDTNTSGYSHHGSWNCPGCATPKPFDLSNPFYNGAAGQLPYVNHSDNVDATKGFTFLAEAGKVYSVYLGGVGFSHWSTGVDNYRLNMSTASIMYGDPLPGGIGYTWGVIMDDKDRVSLVRHVGAKSWHEAPPGYTEPDVGWTHTSDWVALELTEPAVLKITVERQMGVVDEGTLMGDKLYPAFSVYEGWENDGDVDHRYNPVSNISWAEDLTYLGHAANPKGKPTVSYTAKLPAGRYTIAIGGANYLFCKETEPCYEGRHGYEATLRTMPSDFHEHD